MCLSAHEPVMLNCVITQLNFSKNYSVTDIHKYTDFYLYKHWLRLHCKAENILRNMCEFIWNLSWSTHLIPHSVSKVSLRVWKSGVLLRKAIDLFLYTRLYHGMGKEGRFHTQPTHTPSAFSKAIFQTTGPPPPMIGENRRLVTDAPVRFEKWLVEVGDFRRITDCFGGIDMEYTSNS